MLKHVTWSPLFLETPPALHPGDAFLTLADQNLALVGPASTIAQENLQNLATGILASRRAILQLDATFAESQNVSNGIVADMNKFNPSADLAQALEFEAVFHPPAPALSPLGLTVPPAAPATPAPVYVPPPPPGPRLPPGIRLPMIP